jgi:tetratricopeptide (TPR) repeat protein
MTCKESMVTAPLAVLLFDRVFVFASLREAFRERGTFYAALAGTWTVLAVLMASGGRTTVGFDAGVSAWTYLLNQAVVIVDYLRLAFWPRALVVDYGVPQALAPGEVLMPAAVIAALATATLVALRYKPAAGFLGAIAFLTLAPTSSIVPIATEVGAERRMYLPLAALVVLVVCAAFLGGRAAVPRIARRLTTAPDAMASVASRWLAFGAVAVVVVMLVAGTLIRNAEYHSAEVLARTSVERKPHGRAYYALGNALFQEGKREEAISYFRRSARDFPAAHFPLGSEFLADGHLDDGIAELRRFIELMPNHMAVGGARQMIATALGAQGRMDEAIAELQIAIGIEPRDPRLNGLLGEFLLRNNQLPEAVHYLGRAVTLQPSARLFDLLGTAYALQGQLQEALPRFRMAAQLDPNHPTARANVERAEQLLARSAATR